MKPGARLVLVMAVVAAGCGGEPGHEVVRSEFWKEREATYRKDLRGPFTAIYGGYLERRDALRLYAYRDSVSTEPGGTMAVEIRYDHSWDFTVRPVEGYDPPILDGDRVETGYQVGDGADLRLGHYLFSFGPQPPDLGRVLVYDPRRLDRFEGFTIFPEEDRFVVEAKVSSAEGDTITLGTTRGLERDYVRVATLEFEVGGKSCRLSGFRSPEKETDPLFVPFLDATSGEESYGVGRYLRVEHAAGAPTATIDFNRATNPWCAYSPFYNCVLPPEENRLAVAIRAGERAPSGHGTEGR